MPNEQPWLLPLTDADLHQITDILHQTDAPGLEQMLQLANSPNPVDANLAALTTLPYITSTMEQMIGGASLTQALHKTLWIALVVSFRAGQLAQIRSMGSALLGEDKPL